MILYIKYMVSNRCKMAVKEVLKKMGLYFILIDLGVVEVMEPLSASEHEQLKAALLLSGLELMDDKKGLLIEKIKQLIIEMIHDTDEFVKVNFSEYLSLKLNQDYGQLSHQFSEAQGSTIAQFIIVHKIERVKDLMFYGNLNMTEIAYKMNYSSVAHLSNQFKKVTGLTPTDFKQLKAQNEATSL